MKIEKLNQYNDPRYYMDKINELVDAVNALMSKDGQLCKCYSEKRDCNCNCKCHLEEPKKTLAERLRKSFVDSEYENELDKLWGSVAEEAKKAVIEEIEDYYTKYKMQAYQFDLIQRIKDL